MSHLIGKKLLKEPVDGIHHCYSEDIIDRKNFSKSKKWKKENPLRYLNLPMENRVLIDSILRGVVTSDQLPPQRSRVVRIYLASTATDMNVEKTMLMSTIYPSLRDYCRSQYHLDFLVTDLSYGIMARTQHHVDDDHCLAEICAKELKRCDEKSAGPSFLCLLGQKYGSYDLPAKILYQEFETIREAYMERRDDLEFLHQWYRKDSNQLPAVYRLQPISHVLGDDKDRWVDVKNRLISLLLAAIPEEASDWLIARQLSVSRFHTDIISGLRADNVMHRTVTVNRTISDVHEKLDRDKVDNFVDITPKTNAVHRKSRHTIDNVKQLVQNNIVNLSAENSQDALLQYEVSWSDPYGIHKTTHHQYLEQLGRDVYQKLKLLIDDAMNKRQKFTDVMEDVLYEENLFHWQQANANIAGFVGRGDELEYIRNYCLDVTTKPLIVHGESGIGKSALLSMAATMFNLWLTTADRQMQTAVIYRQCGATTHSTSIRQMLKLFCHQISYTTDKYRHHIPDDYASVKQHFVNIIQKGEFHGIVAIFIDGLNHLSPDDNAYRLDWLPTKIANNVKIIVSTTDKSEERYSYKDCNDDGMRCGGSDTEEMSANVVTASPYELLACLRRKITSDLQYLHLTGLSTVACIDLLDNLLHQHKCSLTLTQWKLIRDCLQENSSPLFVKYIGYESLTQWRSSDDVEDLEVAPSLVFVIQRLLKRLEKRHGHVLVSHALGLITATKDAGLSELELLDLLSLDDDVLNHVFVSWEPKVRRLPGFLWSHLYHDISPYLCEVEQDRCTVMRWAHPLIGRVVHKAYLDHQFTYRYIHSLLADYYAGRWNQTLPKHFAYPPHLAARLKLDDPVSASLRYTPLQANEYSVCNGRAEYNLRKLNHLPYHLLHAGRYADLCEDVLFNHDWILTKIRATSVQQTLPDYNLTKGRDAQLVRQALQMSETALTANSSLLCIELSGRLLPYYQQFPNIKHLIDSCDLAAQASTLLAPNWQTYTAPGGVLQYMCELDKDLQQVKDMKTISADDMMLMAIKPFSRTDLHLWDVVSGEPLPGFELPANSSLYQTISGDYLCTFRDNTTMETYKLDSGECVGEVECLEGQPCGSVSVGDKYLVVCHDCSSGPSVIDVEAQALLHRFPYEAQAVSCSHDDRYLICNSRDTIHMHALPLMERVCSIKCDVLPRKLMLCRTNQRFFGLFAEKEVHCFSVNLMKKTVKSSVVVRDRDIQDFVLSFSERYLLVRLARRVYLIHTDSSEVLQTISAMPLEVFVDEIFEFLDAQFTPNDVYIVACRHTYLGVWDTATGEALRVLQSNISQITAMFTCRHANRVVTTLADGTMQVWNMDNIDSSTQYCNTMVQGGICLLDNSRHSPYVVCVGTRSTEAKVINLTNGECSANLVHELSDNSKEPIVSAVISPCGGYVVTRTANMDTPADTPEWSLLRHDILWDVHKQDVVYQVTRNRYVLFTPDDSLSVFFRCSKYDPHKWSATCYYVVQLTGDKQSRSVIEIPKGDLVTQPIIAGKTGGYLVFVQQQQQKPAAVRVTSAAEEDDNMDARAPHRPELRRVRLPPSVDMPRRSSGDPFDTYLCIHSFATQWRGIKQIPLRELWSGTHHSDRIITAKQLNENSLLVIYAKNAGQLHHDNDGTIDISRSLHKAALIYDIAGDSVLHRMDSFLHNTTNLHLIQISHKGNIVLDQCLRVYETMSATRVLHKSEAKLLEETGHNETSMSDVHLLLDGRYLAAIIKPGCREIGVWRTSDGSELTRCFVHGFAVCITVASDDRSILVGCTDGRIMAISWLADLSDAIKEHVSLLPSRSLEIDYNLAQLQATRVESKSNEETPQTSSLTSDTMSSDIRMINRSLPQLRALSSASRSKVRDQHELTNSYRRVHSAVSSERAPSRVRSQACVVQ